MCGTGLPLAARNQRVGERRASTDGCSSATLVARPFDLRLDSHILYSTFLGAGNACKQFRDEKLQISEPVGRCA